jgi:uncharacterized protein YjbJ (UPF0337 family)
MRWNQIAGNWKPFYGYETRGELTYDETKQSAGKREILLGKLQEGLGVAQDQAKAKAKEQGRYSGKTMSGSFFIF